MLCAALLPAALSAQAPLTATGQVLRVTSTDSIGVPGIQVVLHEVGVETQGPRDSIRTDATGRFRFRFRPDTLAVYLVSARFDGIVYFSDPIDIESAAPSLALIVSDTSTTEPVTASSRHVVLRAPDVDGARQALDIVVLRNTGTRTRVGRDTTTAAWGMPLPPGIAAATVGDADFSPDAISIRNDSALVFAPIAPGEKQVVIQYVVPPDLSPLRIPIADSIGVVTLLAEETGVRVRGLAPADSQVIAGTSFSRWTGTPDPGTMVEVTVPTGSGTGPAPSWVLPALVAALGAVLLGAMLWLLRGRPRQPPAAA